MLKNIVFDFGNVVMNYDPDKILDHYDLSPTDHELLKKTIFQSKEWLEIDRGNLSEDEATKIFVKKLPERLHDQARTIMQTWPSKVFFYQDVFDWMKELKADGYHIYALSNTGMRFANYLMKSKYGENFDGGVFSAAEKLMKPDARINEKLLTRFNLKAGESLFIDDLKENTAAAEDLGMYGFTFWIDKLSELKDYVSKIGKEQ